LGSSRLGWILGILILLLAAVPASAARPSIVLVLTDDQDEASVETMPKVLSLIARQGARFQRAYVNEPLCGPSRATILTGKYAQNTKVTTNIHAQFLAGGNPASTVAVGLQAAGYRTGLFGKYLNHYPGPEADGYVPPGWDDWAARLGDRSEPYDYTLNENGKLDFYGSGASNHATDVYATKAVAFIRQAAADDVPFFVALGLHAPHIPSTPARRHADLFLDLAAPRTPAFDEADVSDKPAYIRGLPPFSDEALARIDEAYRERVRSLQAVDEAVAAIVDTLSATGRLAETYIVFTSDNGWVHGQHRIPQRKRLAYEESIKVPLLVRGPGIAPGIVLDHLVGNADLAPTFAAWAGVTPPGDVDGRSLAPLLQAGAPGPESWRQAYPLTQATAGSAGLAVPDWRGVRTRDHTYVEYQTGEIELYDTRTDPDQLDNLAGSASPELLGRLARLTEALASCKAEGCRKLEDAPLSTAWLPGQGDANQRR
jgi:arylsulfatase A-like enzyme